MLSLTSLVSNKLKQYGINCLNGAWNWCGPSRNRFSSHQAKMIPTLGEWVTILPKTSYFFTDFANKRVRVMHLREVFANVRDVYRAPFDISPKIYTVCYVHNLDTLVVCSTEIYSSKKQNKNGDRVPCLLALSRYQDGWRVKLEFRPMANVL